MICNPLGPPSEEGAQDNYFVSKVVKGKSGLEVLSQVNYDRHIIHQFLH